MTTKIRLTPTQRRVLRSIEKNPFGRGGTDATLQRSRVCLIEKGLIYLDAKNQRYVATQAGRDRIATS